MDRQALAKPSLSKHLVYFLADKYWSSTVTRFVFFEILLYFYDHTNGQKYFPGHHHYRRQPDSISSYHGHLNNPH
jgi:hypothetical protein